MCDGREQTPEVCYDNLQLSMELIVYRNRKNTSPQTAAQASNGINGAQGKGDANITQSMLDGLVDPAVLAHDQTWRRMSAESASSTFNENTMDASSSHVPHYLCKFPTSLK